MSKKRKLPTHFNASDLRTVILMYYPTMTSKQLCEKCNISTHTGTGIIDGRLTVVRETTVDTILSRLFLPEYMYNGAIRRQYRGSTAPLDEAAAAW